MNTTQLAEMLGLSGVTLELWRRQGKGPAYLQLGRRVVYDRLDIDAWLAGTRRGGVAIAVAAVDRATSGIKAVSARIAKLVRDNREAAIAAGCES